jgi:hypothetical protein
LTTGHTLFNRIDGTLIEEVALLNIDAVHASGSQQSDRGSQDKALNYFHECGE